MKNLGDFFFVVGWFVSALLRMISENQTADEAMLELYKDIIFASNKGIERIEAK
jgi:hypothetical protein